MSRCRKSIYFLCASGMLYVSAIVYAGLSATPAVADLAVVLGNEVLSDGRPSNRLKARLDSAVSVYRRGLVHFVMVSGGIGKSGYDEAAVMAKYLASQGIPAGDIFIDSKGINTMATALNTAALAQEKHFTRMLIVTQYYHILRTEFAFRRAGMQMLSADYPRYFELYDLLAILREAVAIPAYFIKMPTKE